MARLPQGADLARVATPSQTPGISVKAADYGALVQGDQAIARGVSGLADLGGKVLDLQAKADSEVDDYATRKRLLDFKLQTEMDLEAHKREMPQGGAGYADAWNAKYMQAAKAFVGKDDANIPAHLRNQVGLLLKSHETQLLERAQRDEWAERDRSEIDGLEQTLGVTRSRVEADPARRDEMRMEGDRLIDTSRIQPAAKDRLKKHYAKELDKTAVISRLMKAQTADEFKALEQELAPHKPDRGTGLATLDFIKREEGDKDAGWDYRQFSGPYGVKRANDERLTLPQAEQRLRQEVGQVQAEIDARLPGLPENQRTALTSLFYNMGTGKGRLEQVAKMIEGGQADKVPAWIRQYNRNADGGFMEGLASRRSREAALFAAGGNTAPDGEAYSGPYAGLTLSERRAFVGQIETQRRKLVGTVEKVIKDQMGVAESGMLPPDAIKAELDKQVRAIGDPMLTAQYATLMRKAEATAYWQKAPPVAIEAAAQRMRSSLDGKATKEQLQDVEHMEKLAESTKEVTSKDPMTWAHKVGVAVPLAVQPPDNLDPGQRARWQPPVEKVQLETIGTFQRPDIDAVLQRRFAQAKGVALYNGKPVQAFTEIERNVLNDSLKMGGDGMLHTMGTIARSAAAQGIDPAMVMREFTKDAPEVAMIGELVANGGDGNMLTTAAKALAWRHGMGEKFQSTIDKARAKPELGEFAVVLGATPTKVDHVKALANLVYEYESRAKGRTEFEPEEYTKVVKRIMGETTDSRGSTYGGVGNQGTGWGIGLFGRGADGKAGSKVLVPAGVKQNGFDEMVDALRANDLIDAGGVPMAENGEPLTMAEIRRATWVSVGPGRYALKLRDGASGEPIWAKGTTASPSGSYKHIVDVRPILPRIKQRQPSIFAGYDPTMDATPAASADPALPTWWTGKPQPAADAPQPEIGAAP